jgi:hypothetical protein
MNRDDIHTCHSECQRPICVAVREAVTAEREACAMITLTREEAQQVLDALADAAGCVQENYQPGHIGHGWGKEIETLRTRLSAPEPEPVAWEYCGALFYDKEEVFAWHERGDISNTPPKPLYAAPPQREWQGLTDEEVGMLTVFDGLHHVEVPLLAEFIRAIEAKLKGKNYES